MYSTASAVNSKVAPAATRQLLFLINRGGIVRLCKVRFATILRHFTTCSSSQHAASLCAAQPPCEHAQHTWRCQAASSFLAVT